MRHLNFRSIVLVLVQGLLLAACSPAGDGPKQQAALPSQENAATREVAPAPVPVPAPDATQPGTAALREFVDPVTGQRRAPTSAELKALQDAGKVTASAATAPARPKEREIVFPDGTVAVEEGSLSQMQGCLQKDGTVTVDHDCKSNAQAPAKKP
jgi:hypothetical protein